MNIRCPRCTTLLEIENEAGDQVIKCHSCLHTFSNPSFSDNETQKACMKIECPYCHTPLEVDDDEVEFIRCAACQYDFQNPKWEKPPPYPLKPTPTPSPPKDDKPPQKVDIWAIYPIWGILLALITLYILGGDFPIMFRWIWISSIWGAAISIVFMLELFLHVRWAAQNLADINRQMREKASDKQL